MKIHVATYVTPSFRLNCVHNLLGQLTAQGLSAQLVHPSILSARALSETMGLPVMSMHDLRFMPVEAEVLVVIDGDIIGFETAETLMKRGKDCYFVVPADALPGVADFDGVKDLMKQVQITDFDERPRTGGCHHLAETCRACEDLVITWKAKRRDAAAALEV
jgi:hypothetical protein